jgi:hypothetical protein
VEWQGVRVRRARELGVGVGTAGSSSEVIDAGDRRGDRAGWGKDFMDRIHPRVSSSRYDHRRLN